MEYKGKHVSGVKEAKGNLSFDSAVKAVRSTST